jgi:mRNA-degrading endonuclease RelE of RelBE toxin-antitoxin system
MYEDRYGDKIIEKLERLKKKDKINYTNVMKKIDQILLNPEHEYKNLRYTLKTQKRVHIGHLVLIFEINHEKKTLYFDDLDHHDNIYK